MALTPAQDDGSFVWVKITRSENPYIELKDAAEEYGVNERHMRLLCEQGYLGHRITAGWVITREEFEAFKKKRRPRLEPSLAETRKDRGPIA